MDNSTCRGYRFDWIDSGRRWQVVPATTAG
ncbi:hypothetical protein P3T37_000336 [Kitasatospora sp. MAA4]|nr:hypothetical protein [Kitasatospora sp. MAA4]